MTDLSATTGVTDRPSGTTRSAGPDPVRRFLDEHAPQTPCLVVDLATVRSRYRQLRAALPDARICYAVKANPAPEVVGELVALGSAFDVASPGEIDLCLAEGADPASISYGNTIKKPRDIARAHEQGVRLFATDSAADLAAIAECAPGAAVFCRVLVDNEGSRTPFGRKFGCAPESAAQLLVRARELGLDPYGVSFHIGSQQLDPNAWEHGIAAAGRVFADCARAGAPLRMVDLGGGLPAAYTEDTPRTEDYVLAIERALQREFGADRPELLIEPGRYIAGDAGVLRSEVVLVSEAGDGAGRWVYLDIGRYNGLAETEGEAIAYRLRTARDDDPTGPVVIAGPTCDGDDVLYQRTRYELPVTLRSGDWVDLLSAGAYTASYSSVGFNGFTPLPTYCVDGEQR
ncbi:type III PLP-dependent enzyme [Saccharopolyspora sp. HNM0983]|uniref:ornithine decarboxylase n=1 Tax=Saccharopolyspora montiporae TaxID=2781240 RepID=A0A929BC46_9PSEU|nr:type III PLP-dependent enzyme [Saccharopolyspora sp. HNM0983]MBE9376126.1 type III PLP-dependent enzyme [Saccharopolyspora sp. HNM0983]